MSVIVSYDVANPIILTSSIVTVGFNFNNLNYTLTGGESIAAYVPYGDDTLLTTTTIAFVLNEEIVTTDSISYSYDYSGPISFQFSVPTQKGGTNLIRTFQMEIPVFKPYYLNKTKGFIKSSNGSFTRKMPQNNISRKQHPRF